MKQTTTSEICVIGRLDFSTGIGAVCYSACELLSRSFPISIFPVHSGYVSADYIELPNGRQIPVCKDLNSNKVFFYTDVLWGGDFDHTYTQIPNHGLRIAHVAYDSDEFPAKWVEIFNTKFDVVYFSCQSLEEIAIKSGVKIPVGTLPIGLPIEDLLIRKPTIKNKKIRFGSVAAFHPRKGIESLVDAFVAEFKNDSNVELLLHSNLEMGGVYDRIAKKIENSDTHNIVLSNQNLNYHAKADLIDSIDIFVNCSRGEGYSIGPREALALGKVLVLSDIAAHRDLLTVPGTFAIPATIKVPGRYPEINNQIFGNQYAVEVPIIQEKLRESYQFFNSPDCLATLPQRRRQASEFSFFKLTKHFAEIITPDISSFKKLIHSSKYTHISSACKEVAISTLGRFGSRFKEKNRIILPAHDGGFFSVFNVFMSHLVWELQEDRCHMVLPDWDVSRLMQRHNNKMMSFCYGRPQDGNIWLKLFKPLFGLSAEQMNCETFLYEKSELPTLYFNEHREPLLGYVHAYDLYKSAFFKAFRKQYHKIFTGHIQLLDPLQNEIDTFSERHITKKFMIAIHIKHPSHILEQPGKSMANTNNYMDAVKIKLKKENIAFDSNDWGIFLATDQDRVVSQFKEEFGTRVCFFEDVRRTKIAEDEMFDRLPEHEKAKEGFQVQHLVTATPENWSIRMAWEVIRDAMVMARCKVLFHIVSNVSTAASYFNPDLELIFVEPTAI